jgi:hypothetical protein
MVTYDSDEILFMGTLESLCASIAYAKRQNPNLHCTVSVIDNEPVRRKNLRQAEQYFRSLPTCLLDACNLDAPEKNLGYGAGHNRAIVGEESDYHLVLNPDVRLDEKSIDRGLAFLGQNSAVGLVAPAVYDEAGKQLFLCKRFPAVLDLLLRGFAPDWLKRFFCMRLSDYEMAELAAVSEPVHGVKVVSGCFMLMRTDLLQACGGFDEGFFLYFEDFDLSLRMGEMAEVVYLPGMKICHYGGQAARKGGRHISLFASSALRFYRQHGWRWW